MDNILVQFIRFAARSIFGWVEFWILKQKQQHRFVVCLTRIYQLSIWTFQSKWFFHCAEFFNTFTSCCCVSLRRFRMHSVFFFLCNKRTKFSCTNIHEARDENGQRQEIAFVEPPNLAADSIFVCCYFTLRTTCATKLSRRIASAVWILFTITHFSLIFLDFFSLFTFFFNGTPITINRSCAKSVND